MKKFKKLNYDKTKKNQSDKTEAQIWQNSKKQIMTKLKKTNYDKTQKFKLWQNSKIEIGTKLKNSNCVKTQIVTKIKIKVMKKKNFTTLS